MKAFGLDMLLGFICGAIVGIVSLILRSWLCDGDPRRDRVAPRGPWLARCIGLNGLN
jgi:hypothetical protein